MIARLTGLVAELTADHAVLEVGGVGYRVAASTRTLAALGGTGTTATLHTEMLVREDAITLVGFASAQERDWFGLLLGVQGVGAKGRARHPVGTVGGRDRARDRRRRWRDRRARQRCRPQARRAHRERS